MKPTVIKLTERDKPAILRHFKALSADSIRMRFGSPMTAAALERYVSNLCTVRDVLLGIVENNELAAFMHVALVSETHGVRELGVSVSESNRRQGLAAILLRYVKDLAFYEGWQRVEMLHVSDNVAISKLCKKERLYLIRDGHEYLGVWETVHAYQHSMDQEAPYIMGVLQEVE